MTGLFPILQNTLQDCDCKNTYVDADYAIMSAAPLETKMSIIQEFKAEFLGKEEMGTKYSYCEINGYIASIDFSRATPRGQEWLVVLLNPESRKVELDAIRHLFQHN